MFIRHCRDLKRLLVSTLCHTADYLKLYDSIFFAITKNLFQVFENFIYIQYFKTSNTLHKF